MTAFQRFTDKLRKAVSKRYGETCLVEVNEIEKNNGFLNSQKGMPAINIFTLEISINGDMNWDWSAIPFVLPSYMVR